MSRLLFTAAIVLIAPASAQAAYFAQIEDVPIPPGFSEVIEGQVIENEEGRVVLEIAEGRSSAEQIREFYLGSLSQLGWALIPDPEGALVFQRGRETLNFRVREGAARTVLSARLVTHFVPAEPD